MWRLGCVAICLSLAVPSTVAQEGGGGTKEKYWELRKALLKDYDPLASPVGPTADDAVTLDVGVTILKISVDEIGHSMWMTMWLKLAFKDERLTWDPAQYGGIEELRVSSASVWIPDLALYSEVPSSHAFAGIMDELDHVDAIVYKDGKVLFVPPVRLGVQCIFDYWNFPNDVQKCNMTFGSWTMSANQLKLSLGILSRHEPYNIMESDGSWTIKATNSSLNSKVYECCPEEYMDVTHEFTLTRRPGTYQATLLIPVHMVVIMMVISILFAPGTILKYAIFILNTAVLLALLLVNQERMATSQRTPRIYTFMCAYIVFQTFLFLCDGFFLCIRSCRKPLPDVVIKVFRLNASDYSIAENHPLESADHPNEHNETVERKSSVQCKRQAQAEQLSCRLQGLLFVCMLIVTIIMYATTWPVPS